MLWELPRPVLDSGVPLSHLGISPAVFAPAPWKAIM
jgi:hypothetical protein